MLRLNLGGTIGCYISMAYCDYLFRRSNGIFYFRHVLKFSEGIRKEIRLSLQTRSYVLAKRMAANYYAKLQLLIDTEEILKMNVNDKLKEIKAQFMREVDPDDQDHISLFDDALSKVQKKVDWAKVHLSSEFEEMTLEGVLDAYRKVKPVFEQVSAELRDKELKKLEEDISRKARAYYGLETHSSDAIGRIDESFNLKISEVVEKYCGEMLAGKNWRDKTHQENLATYDLFIKLQGDIYMGDITVRNITNWKSQLQKIPKNFRKISSLKDKQLLDIVSCQHSFPTISITTVNSHLSKISTLLNWAAINKYCRENVAEGVKIKQNRNALEERLPFTNSELSQIFSSGIYNGQRLHSYYFWLPLLGLLTGARLNEICQLDISDIKKTDDIYYIDVNDNNEKTLKNPSAKRKIPIHSKLIEIGFLEFIETAKNKKNGSKKIFGSIKKGRDGYGSAPSKWFTRFKKTIDLESPERKVFHSFRHNFTDAMKRAELPDNIVFQLIGHKNTTVTYGTYGSRAELEQLKENIEKISYEIPELDTLQF